MDFADVTDDLGREYTVPEGITIQDVVFKSEIQASALGEYIAFRPGGRTDAATITLVSETNTIKVACESPLGSFHVVKAVAP